MLLIGLMYYEYIELLLGMELGVVCLIDWKPLHSLSSWRTICFMVSCHVHGVHPHRLLLGKIMLPDGTSKDILITETMQDLRPM